MENDPDSDVNGTFIFGNDLTKQSELDGNDIPNVVQKCVKAVEIRGIHQIIIFYLFMPLFRI